MHEQDEKLLEEAKRARDFAYCPYSKFAVGAAVLAASGKIYTGCNVENSSLSLVNCAERTAVFRAISSGEDTLISLAVIGDAPEPVAPCGACRQVMAEFNVARVIMANTSGEINVMTLEELLPVAFTGDDLTNE